jgi:VanZ family protein
MEPPSNRTEARARAAPVRPNQPELSPDHAATDGKRAGHIVLVLAIVTVGIVLGSLYPFAFRIPAHGIGPVRTLLQSWAEVPGRGDFSLNILLYIPFGMFAVLSLRHRTNFGRRLPVVITCGGALSVALELAQYFDDGRVTSATDVYANVLGTTAGAVAMTIFRINSRFLLIDQLLANLVPTLVVASWAAYRLYPYVPTIDLHKYWNALKPVILFPSLTSYDLYRHAVIWLTLFALIEGIVGKRRSKVFSPLFAAGIVCAKVLIINAVLSVAELAGAAVALCVWPALAFGRTWRNPLLAILFGVYVIAHRLEPFRFAPFAHGFGWMPFASFMTGSLEVDTMSFLEKFFVYGGWLFLLTEARLSLRFSTLFVVATLFATSWLETYLPGRSAEITDAVMALLIAAVFALLRNERRQNSVATPRFRPAGGLP